ncbi:MAG: chemotaxis protein CheW [Pseudohongiellaceae bacterium]
MDIQTLAEVIPIEGEVQLDGIDFITNGDQYLTFCVGDENYGVDILSVKEIRGWESPTLIPNAPDRVKGVINIRGVIVPIVDLRIAFDIGEALYSPTTVVIVLTVELHDTSRVMGFVVDAVSDVLDAERNEISPVPNLGGTLNTTLLEGMVNVDDSVVTIINIKQLLTLDKESDDV